MHTLGANWDVVRAANEKTQWRCFEKGNIELAVNQSHPLPGLPPEKMRIKKSQAGNPALQQYLP